MAKSNRQRRFLNIVIVASVFGILVGLAPTMKQRIERALGRPGASRPEGKWGEVSTDRGGREAQGSGRGAPGAYGAEAPISSGSERKSSPAPDRRVQQAQVLRYELAERERMVAAQEEILRRQVLEEFWKRQAVATLATVALAALVLLLMARRIADWSGLSKRIREEESRMRNLQLSVIGGLEEFESELAAARAWAAAEARARRPGSETARSAGDLPWRQEQDPVYETPCAGAPFFKEQPDEQQVGAESSAWDLPAVIERSAHGKQAHAPEEVVHPAAPAEPLEGARHMEPMEVVRPMQPASPREGEVGEAGAFQGNMPAEVAAIQAPAIPESWARRFVVSEPGPAAHPQVEPAQDPPTPGGSGPWAEPIKRQSPTPVPAHQPTPSVGGPGPREQVEYLAAEGLGEGEIARRLGLSREEVHLALALGQDSRLRPARPPQRSMATQPEKTAQAVGWVAREPNSHEVGM